MWQSAKCSHSGNCFRNLPKVFRPSERMDKD
ncbi:MAG: (4Fe-4S)-binding protein [Lutibacter sp.]